MPPLPLKPPARARKIPALHRGERLALTPQAIEELFRAADVLAEGSLDGDPAGSCRPPCWYGSIMITFDLDRFAARCRGLDDPGELDRVVEAIQTSVRVRIRTHRIACGEVYRRFPDRRVGTAQLESRFVRQGSRLLLDIDVEAPLDRPSRRRAP